MRGRVLKLRVPFDRNGAEGPWLDACRTEVPKDNAAAQFVGRHAVIAPLAANLILVTRHRPQRSRRSAQPKQSQTQAISLYRQRYISTHLFRPPAPAHVRANRKVIEQRRAVEPCSSGVRPTVQVRVEPFEESATSRSACRDLHVLSGLRERSWMRTMDRQRLASHFTSTSRGSRSHHRRIKSPML